jgi:hypothetical protein
MKVFCDQQRRQGLGRAKEEVYHHHKSQQNDQTAPGDDITEPRRKVLPERSLVLCTALGLRDLRQEYNRDRQDGCPNINRKNALHRPEGQQERARCSLGTNSTTEAPKAD